MSPDGRLLVVQRTVDGNADLWLVDLARGFPTRFTFTDFREAAGVWSPDGRQLVFGSERAGVYDLFTRPADGSAAEVALLTSPEHKTVEDWSPDGRFLAYQAYNPDTDRDIWALPLSGPRTPTPIATSKFEEWLARFSPDGRWIAYQSDESGQPEVYIQPFPGRGSKVQVTTGGGRSPEWRPDGSELFYLGPGGRVTAVAIDLKAQTVETSPPVVLFTAPLDGQFIVSRDGQRFLFSKRLEGPSRVMVILNWAGLAR